MEPKLRFKEFSGDWEKKRLGEIVEIKSGKSPNGLLNEKGTIPFFKVEQLNNSIKYQENTPYYIKKEFGNIVKSGSIIFPKRGAAILLNKIRILKQDSFMDTNLMTLTIKNNNYYNEFIYYKILRDDLSKIADTTSIPQINNKHIEPYEINIPLLPEQTKIADFLSTVDEKIQNQQDKISHLENIKKGFMQKIFSRKIRFKDANGNEFPKWEEKKIKDILKEVVEKTTVLNQYEVLSSTSNGIYTQKEYFNRDIASKDNVGYKVLKINQIVLSPQNLWMGNINLNKSFKIGMVSPSYKIFDVIKGNNSNFMGYLLRTPKAFYEYTISSEQGASIVRRNLNMDLFNDIKFMIPCLEEQQKIADFLSSFDEKIDAEKEILEHLKELKKGLLQQMFV